MFRLDSVVFDSCNCSKSVKGLEMLNVDLGYLTFKLAFGGFESWQHKHGANVSIAAVDNKSKRKELYPEYKKYRNVGKDDVIRMVWDLRKQVETDKLLPICSIEGLEADDLVACWHLFNPNDDIVGVDKDFFQLPGLTNVFYHSMKNYNKLTAIEKLPDYVQELAIENFALYQILLGDVADNIPRLLAKGNKGKQDISYLLEAQKHNDLGDSLIDLYGEQVIINAGLVLLPYFEYGDFEGHWFDCWAKGHYYKQSNWTNLYEQMKDCLGENKVSQDNAIWDMFSLA